VEWHWERWRQDFPAVIKAFYHSRFHQTVDSRHRIARGPFPRSSVKLGHFVENGIGFPTSVKFFRASANKIRLDSMRIG
jgi:hypothetical protein